MGRILSARTESTVYAQSKLRLDSLTPNVTVTGQGTDFTLADGKPVDIRVLRLKNATCFAYSDVVLLDNGQCLFDLKEIPHIQPYCRFAHEALIQDTDNWCQIKPWKKSEHLAKAIKIGGMFGFNYYHLLFQLLPRMFETAVVERGIPLLLDKRVAEIPNMKQLVEWCNLESRDIVYMDTDVAYSVDELYVINSGNICIPNLKPGYSLYEPKAVYSPNSIQQLSRTLLPYRVQKSTPERVFISRRKATGLRTCNEDELYQVLKPLGFEEVFPEELSVAEQISVFHQAKMIASSEGAALSNLLFIQPGCKVIVFYCMPGLTSEFGSLVLMNGGELIELYDIPDGDLHLASYQRNYHIDPAKLQALL